MFCCANHAQAEKVPIRMALGFFSATALDAETQARLRKNIESAVIHAIAQCPQQLEFVPENADDAYIYFDNQNFQFARDYKRESGTTAVPSKANFVISLGLDANAQYGPQLILDVYHANGKSLRFLARGEANSDYVLRVLTEPSRLKAFAEEAVSNTLTDNRFRAWLDEEGVHSSALKHCFIGDVDGEVGGLMYDFAVSCTGAKRITIDGEEVILKGGNPGYLQLDIAPGKHRITVWNEYEKPILQNKMINITQNCLTLRGCSTGMISLKRAPGCED